MTKWVTKKLGEIGDIVTGSTPQTNKDIYWNGEYNFYSPADFTEDIYCKNTERTVTELGLNTGRIIPDNSIMVACIASIGKLAINKTKGITNQQINTIIPYPNNDYKFIYYLLLHNVNSIKSKAAQTTIPIINKEDFSSLEFLVPESLAEQRRIAGILSSADGAIAASEALIAKYRNIKRGLLTTLLQPKDGWKKVKLGECLTRLCNGLTYDVEEKSGYMVTRIETISNDDIDYNRVGHIRTLPKQEYRIQKGDILFSHINSVKHIGKVAYFDDEQELYHGMNLLLMRFHESCDSKFFFYMLSSEEVRKRMRSLAKSAVNQASINTTELHNFLISYPEDLAEQRRIADILSSVDAKIAVEEKVVEKYKGVKKGLMEEMMKEKKI